MPTDDVLSRLVRHRDRMQYATNDATAFYLAAIAHEVENTPVLINALEGRLREPAPWLREAVDPPADAEQWGADAAAVLVIAARCATVQASHMRTVLPMLLKLDFGGAFVHNEADAAAKRFVPTFVDPILEWAQHVLGALPGFSEAVRRWAIRIEAFGIPGLPTRAKANPKARLPNEHAFQLDLARFLYDQGFDLGKLGREQVLRERTGRGARIDFLLRDRSEVAVELVIVRRGRSLSSANKHVIGLRDYCRTGEAAHGMLVVVNLDPNRRLDIRPAEATAPSGVRSGGAHLLITVADVMRANSSAEGSRKVAQVDLTNALA